MTTSLAAATYKAAVHDLEFMALERVRLPQAYSDYRPVREGPLNNREMAENGFPGSTEERFHNAGRITGYMREFVSAAHRTSDDGFNFIVASVAHLFDTQDSVSAWMNDVFLQDFEEHVGDPISEGQTLASVEKLDPAGFFDDTVALKALHKGKHGELSTTIVDFRVGRILGVAYVGAVGDHERLELATQIGISLEKSIVRAVLATI